MHTDEAEGEEYVRFGGRTEEWTRSLDRPLALTFSGTQEHDSKKRTLTCYTRQVREKSNLVRPVTNGLGLDVEVRRSSFWEASHLAGLSFGRDYS